MAPAPICIYRLPALNSHLPALTNYNRNNKSQKLYMLLFLSLLSNSFVTVIVDRNEIKGNVSKKQDSR